VLNVAPTQGNFINRDRVVFSAGHCSALVYAVLHMCGFKVSMNDLKAFRKYGSITCGHPEFGVCDGVDASTGPLGQGIAMAVGMAMAERHMASKFNKDGFNLIDHYTYSICGEGCLMEGVSYEACSLAGLHKLNKLIIIYDCNKITMDGSSELAFNEDLHKRFEAQGFNVLEVESGASVEEITAVIQRAKQCKDKPSFIIVPSIIGEGTKVAGTNKAHGTPLKLEEAIELKSVNQGLRFLHLAGLDPYLYIDREREVKEYKGLKIFFDDIQLLGKFIEIEYQDSKDARNELDEFTKKFGITGKPEPLYGEIINKKLNSDADFNDKFTKRLKEIVEEAKKDF